jgi:hypothetical protein
MGRPTGRLSLTGTSFRVDAGNSQVDKQKHRAVICSVLLFYIVF